MKQGRASTHSGGGKTEPRSHGIAPDYPNSLGRMRGNHAMEQGTVHVKKIPMYEGRGLKAPMVGKTVHHTGSQGKHK